jgi:hypothetical protein
MDKKEKNVLGSRAQQTITKLGDVISMQWDGKPQHFLSISTKF